jgi:hypothetical protein
MICKLKISCFYFLLLVFISIESSAFAQKKTKHAPVTLPVISCGIPFNRLISLSCNVLMDLFYHKIPFRIREIKNSIQRYTNTFAEIAFFHLHTDESTDQFGGPKGKKIKYKQLDNLLQLNHTLPCKQQYESLNFAFDIWKGEQEQVDDICLLGVTL